MNIKLLSSLASFTVLAACGQASGQPASETSRPDAAATPAEPVQAALVAADGSPAGQVTMRQGPYGLLFTVEGEGWPEGWHGTHLHAVGSCEAPAFESAGGHVNHPEQTRPHGLLNFDGGPDYGDLQNVHAGADGVARAEVYLTHAGLSPDIGDMADGDGLSFVVHANPDDHLSQPIGGAGDRIACAVLIPSSQPASD